MIARVGSQGIISSDVFDTLRLRSYKAEARRFGALGTLAARLLHQRLGVVLPAGDIAAARLMVQRHAYRALALAQSTGDTTFEQLIEATAQCLGLNSQGAHVLREAELVIELEHLQVNGPLLDWLAHRSREGRRIIAVSDIYYDGASLGALLDRLVPGHPIQSIYTSADLDATKRAGTLFPKVVRAEGANPSDILHIGDDYHADVRMAHVAGLSSRHIRRSLVFRMLRKADGVVQRIGQLTTVRTNAMPPTGRLA